MAYQWEQPFVLRDDKFRARFGSGPTPWGVAIGAALAWAQGACGREPPTPARSKTSDPAPARRSEPDRQESERKGPGIERNVLPRGAVGGALERS